MSVKQHVTTSRQWSTPVGLALCGWIFTGAAGLWWASTHIATDRVFVGMLVLVLAAASAYATFVRPRLRADSEGLTLRSLTGAHRWSWNCVHVNVHHSERLGRTVSVLELEVPEESAHGGLIVLGKLDLGEDPRDVAEQIDRIAR